MKKFLAFIVLSIAMVSCYEEYLKDYPYTAIYFYLQQDVRTFVVGEGMKFEIGASLGGVRQNTVDRNVNFSLDPTLITPARLTALQTSSWLYIKNAALPVAALQLLPTNYYTMTPTSVMVIKSGWHGGTVVIKADSTNFLNDSVKTRIATYALPFRIDTANADSILPLKRTLVVGTMYENKLFGNYWHGGAALVNRPSKADTTIVYKTTVPAQDNMIWTLTTLSPGVLSCNGYYNATTSATANQFTLVLKGNNIILSAGTPHATYPVFATGAKYPFTTDGACIFNNDKLLQHRKIFLKYKYTDPVSGYTYHCTDTLTFRNRIRDGINEWQDANPSHYTK